MWKLDLFRFMSDDFCYVVNLQNITLWLFEIRNFSKSIFIKMCSSWYSIFVLLGFSFTDTDNSQDSRGREGTIFYSTLPLPSVHKHSDIYLQLCTWDDYHIFLIAPLVFTRLLLDEIYHLVELDLPPYRNTPLSISLIGDVILIFVCLLVDLILGFVTAIWHEKPVDSNSHPLSSLYYKRTD